MNHCGDVAWPEQKPGRETGLCPPRGTSRSLWACHCWLSTTGPCGLRGSQGAGQAPGAQAAAGSVSSVLPRERKRSPPPAPPETDARLPQTWTLSQRKPGGSLGSGPKRVSKQQGRDGERQRGGPCKAWGPWRGGLRLGKVPVGLRPPPQHQPAIGRWASRGQLSSASLLRSVGRIEGP